MEKMFFVCSVLFTLLTFNLLVAADQMIAVDITRYDTQKSQLDEVKGSQWKEVNFDGAWDGTAMTGPGDNNYGSDGGEPFLVFGLPIDVNPGESTADGKTWQIWARMYVRTDRNSFFWQLSNDGVSWKPATNTNSNRFNDDDFNNSNKWYWQDHQTGSSGFDPELSVGVNYLRIGVRESDPEPASPLIDVVVLRNYGSLGQADVPNDQEVQELLAATPVSPKGNLATTWANIKKL